MPLRRIWRRRPPGSRAIAGFRRRRDSAASAVDDAVARTRHGLDVVGVASEAWELFDFGMNKIPKTDYTDAVVRHIKAMQTPAGNWSTNESRRPPMAAGDFQAAALSIYSLKRYCAGLRQGQRRCRHRKSGEVARERQARDHAGSRVSRARSRMGQCGASVNRRRGARACGIAAG